MPRDDGVVNLTLLELKLLYNFGDRNSVILRNKYWGDGDRNENAS